MVRPLIACVKTGTKYGPEYVTRLRDGVARHLSIPHRFVCYTEAPVDGVECRPLPLDLPGWWAKIGLGLVREPMLYFDLDVIITGDLTELTKWEGFGILDDYLRPSYGSAVMALTGNEVDVATTFLPEMMHQLSEGDQQWWTMCRPNARTFPREWFPSYKVDNCLDAPPDGAKAVVFHGWPKPADITDGWVPALWA